MNKEDAEKWLDYNKRGIAPTRYKLESLVFSDHSIQTKAHFSLNGFELTLLPIPENENPAGNIEGLMPAFYCQVISEASSHHGGNNFDIHECLDRVLPLVGFSYRLPMNYNQWEEYEGKWIKAIGAGGLAYIQTGLKKLPNDNIVQIVSAYEEVSKKLDKRSKKASKIRSRIKEALDLESISKRYSFLSYYSILEIISDDLATNCHCPSKNLIAEDMAKFSLSTKGSQRTKIYFLLNALDHDFDISTCIGISDVRNDIAHGKQEVSHEDFELCKKLTFWASERFILELKKNA
ncbi:MAG TPA: hypothetical protein VIQ03_05240 [Gammaproteobacteria bacterium]